MYGHQNPTVRSTEEGETVGPKMHRAVHEAARRAWQSKKELAEHVGPRGGMMTKGSTQYGYRIVNHCISKGLICWPDPDHPEANPHGMGAIYATEKGERYLENHSDD